MVHEDQLHNIPEEPPDWNDSWWKAALSEGEEDLSLGAGQVVDADQPGTVPFLITDNQPENDWDVVDRIYQMDEIVRLKVVGCNQGGLLVQGEKINGFVPCSHLLAGHKKNEYLQQTIELKVIEFDRDRSRVVLSERAAQAKAGSRIKLLDELVKGSCIPGVITTLTDFGAFVDLGGMEGLIHISELSWGRVDHPSDVVSVGDCMDVYILNIDRVENKVALSLKKLCPNPWETITERYHTGQIIEAVVRNIVSYGAFVRLEEGVDGLIHVSELGENGKDVSPWDVLEENQKISVEIINLDPKEQRLGLSLAEGE